MLTQDDIFLCEHYDFGTPQRLVAVLDELTLTYGVILRGPDGRSRCLRRHLASLSAARAWAEQYAGHRPTMRSRTHVIA
jgi:hypothetical protein